MRLKRQEHGRQVAADIQMTQDHAGYSNFLICRTESQKGTLFSDIINDYDSRRSDAAARSRTRGATGGDQTNDHNGELVTSFSPEMSIGVPSQVSNPFAQETAQSTKEAASQEAVLAQYELRIFRRAMNQQFDEPEATIDPKARLIRSLLAVQAPETV